MVFGDSMIEVDLPDRTQVVGPGVSLPLEPAADLAGEVASALEHPIEGAPLRDRARKAKSVLVAFDDPTVPCYAPMWSTALPIIEAELEAGGVAHDSIRYMCANSLHRQFTHDELGRLIGDDFVGPRADRMGSHDAEDPEGMVHLGVTESGYDVQLNRAVIESDVTVYLNCSTVRGFSGGWKSVCVGLSGYRSIHHHHTPHIMSMSLDRNRMHAMLDEMGTLVDAELGPQRVFKLETVLANPFSVHKVFGGNTSAARSAALDVLREVQPARRDLIEEPADVVVYGVPDWSPYAAYSHNNPILDMISTGLGYLGGMIQALGRPGCTVVLATPARNRWDRDRHPSYPEVWERVLPETKDPDDARKRFEPEFAAREDYIQRYRHNYAFHPVHGIMALYPLKRLQHAARVIIAGAEDPSVPAHCGFESAGTVEDALGLAEDIHGRGCSVAFVDYPMAINR